MMRKAATAVILALVTASMSGYVYGAEEAKINTKIKLNVKASGEYGNWEGVSNVSHFIGSDGEFSFAYNSKKEITVVNTSGGSVGQKIKIPRPHEEFGAVCADGNGNIYVVTGEENKGDDTNKETVFVSKYDKDGNLIATIGDNGSSSLASYYDDSFFTKKPFDAGNCDAAMNGKYLAVNYARSMYNGHQSNSVWLIDTESMNTVRTPEYSYYEFGDTVSFNSIDDIYNSHSFGQRAVKYNDGFLFMSEGDAYDRAFTLHQWNLKENYIRKDDIFHFYVKAGSSDDMFVVNNNFAHIGDIAVLQNGNAAFAATSVKSLNSSAENEKEQLFIQIFDPNGTLDSAEGYVTNGERSGTSGINGDLQVTDHGVKWLTDDNKYTCRYPQMVCAGDRIVVLYEKYAKKTMKQKGVYYMVLDQEGNILQQSRKFKSSASLNPCETPVYTNGYVYWVSNKSGRKGKLFVYKLKV